MNLVKGLVALAVGTAAALALGILAGVAIGALVLALPIAAAVDVVRRYRSA